MKRVFGPLPLRVRLALAALAVEAVMLLALIGNGARLGDQALAAQGEARVATLADALAQTLVGPLAQEDDAVVSHLLDALAREGGVDYAAVRDGYARVVHEVGARDADTLLQTRPIVQAGQEYGALTLGLSGDFLAAARTAYLRQSLGIAALALLASGLLLVVVLRKPTRRIEALSEASRKLAAGELDTPLPTAKSRDEIGQLVASFGHMASSVRESLELARRNEALTARYLGESELERARLTALLSVMAQGILLVGDDGLVAYCNPAFLRIWAFEPDFSPVGLPILEVFERASARVSQREQFSSHMQRSLDTGVDAEPFEIHMCDGRVVTERDHLVCDRDGHAIGHLWVYEDVTMERETADRLIYLAERDTLTGLYNRHRFQRDLDRSLAEAARRGRSCAVLYFDLDEFKGVNDTYGHRAGDALLKRIAGDVGALIRRHETFARLGGDEFAVLLPEVEAGAAEALAERIVRAIGQVELVFEGTPLHVSSSLGIAYFPAHATNAEELIARADMAMYQAKSAGKNTWRTFNPGSALEGELRSRQSLDETIAAALQNDGFALHFQGVYRIDGGLAGLEALLRLPAADGALLAPALFLPAAKKSGRIVEIDRWVIRAVLQRLAGSPDVPAITVNLARRSVTEPGLVDFIAQALKETGVAPQRLAFEIAESTAVAELAHTQRLVAALGALGCAVGLDGFGVGFASFTYLKHLTVATIKIDAGFVRTLVDDADNRTFVHAMINVARGLGRQVAAAGVEDARTLALLRELGVGLVQGWHLDRPSAEHPALLNRLGADHPAPR